MSSSANGMMMAGDRFSPYWYHDVCEQYPGEAECCTSPVPSFQLLFDISAAVLQGTMTMRIVNLRQHLIVQCTDHARSYSDSSMTDCRAHRVAPKKVPVTIKLNYRGLCKVFLKLNFKHVIYYLLKYPIIICRIKKFHKNHSTPTQQ